MISAKLLDNTVSKSVHLSLRSTHARLADLYNVPDAVRPIDFLSDREDSQAYHLKWRKLWLMHL